MTRDICTAVWDATPACKGWTAEGHPLHGCNLNAKPIGAPKAYGHRGDTCTESDRLPDPKVGNVARFTERTA